MENRKTIFVVSAIVIVGVVGIVLLSRSTQAPRDHVSPPDNSPAATTTPAVEFRVEEATISREGEGWVIEATYPALEGEGDAISLINEGIEREVRTLEENFFNSMSGTDSSLMPNAKSALYVEYEDLSEGQVATRRVMSVPLLVSEYMAGAAHPNNFMRTLNFDLETGRMLELSDLFRGDDYLQELSLKSRESLKRQSEYSVDDEWLSEGTAPTEENFTEFLIDGDDLVIIFNPYQVAPYAAGIIRARIPLVEIESIS